MSKYMITIRPEDCLSIKTVYDYRFRLKMELLEKRGYKSDWSGKPISDVTGCHMHEGIIPRSKAPSGLWWHYRIFAEPNCFLLLPEEHVPSLPHGLTREWCIQKAIEYYGHDEVKSWYDSLPFKSRPFILE